jgi:hypothetical protein
MDIRPIRIARVFHIFRPKRLCNDVFHVRVDESLKLVEGVPVRTGHVTHYRGPSIETVRSLRNSGT